MCYLWFFFPRISDIISLFFGCRSFHHHNNKKIIRWMTPAAPAFGFNWRITRPFYAVTDGLTSTVHSDTYSGPTGGLKLLERFTEIKKILFNKIIQMEQRHKLIGSFNKADTCHLGNFIAANILFRLWSGGKLSPVRRHQPSGSRAPGRAILFFFLFHYYSAFVCASQKEQHKDINEINSMNSTKNKKKEPAPLFRHPHAIRSVFSF